MENAKLMLHFRSLMNDYHLKDLSGKIKSVLYAKKKSGQLLPATAASKIRWTILAESGSIARAILTKGKINPNKD